MKRNWDVVRDILLAISESTDHGDLSWMFSVCMSHEIENDEMMYHIKILIDGGILRGEVKKYPGHAEQVSCEGLTLTWAGNDLLDSIRDEGVWKSVKERLSKVGGGATVEILKLTAKMVVSEMLMLS